MKDYRQTLLLPFDENMLHSPRPAEKWLFLNAETLASSSFNECLICEQHMRGTYLALQSEGYSVETSVSEVDFDGALVISGRNRKVNEDNILRAHNAVKEGQVVVVAGDKTSGIQSLRKRFKHLAPESLSKNHAVVFWFKSSAAEIERPSLDVEIEGYQLAAGMFSAKNIDNGSRLLAEQLDDRLFGKVADFGAGWGYLSAELIKRSSNFESVDLFEADQLALAAAKKNVRERAEFHWADLKAEPPRGPYNWIIMNPPFHTGRAADPKLGVTFIEAAAKALPSGGRLLMVANTNLPYEQTLDRLFKKVERRAQASGFKILEAVR